MKHVISLTLALSLFWLLLSGHFSPLLLVLGGVSVVLTVILSLRMDVVDHETHPVHLTGRLLYFWLFLGREVLSANLDVARRILDPRKRISPRMAELPLPQHSDLSRVIYANSITLTPGTVTVRVKSDSLLVHSLTHENMEDLLAQRMARAVPDDQGVNGS